MGSLIHVRPHMPLFVFAAGGRLTSHSLLRLPSRWSLRWKLF